VTEEQLEQFFAGGAEGGWFPAPGVGSHLQLPQGGGEAAQTRVEDRIVGRTRLKGDERGAMPDADVCEVRVLAQEVLDSASIIVRLRSGVAGGAWTAHAA
jgi:hypothetical protein